MATVVSRAATHQSSWQSYPLTAGEASRYAWWTWLALLMAPFVLFMFVAYRLMDNMDTPRDQHMANVWFIGTMAFLAVCVPLTLFYRSRAFHAYWEGNVVAPKDYLRGNLPVWLALEAGGILALVGCLVSNSLIPCMIPAVAAFMFFVPLWPSGSAMIHPNTGNTDDHARYEEPR